METDGVIDQGGEQRDMCDFQLHDTEFSPIYKLDLIIFSS